MCGCSPLRHCGIENQQPHGEGWVYIKPGRLHAGAYSTAVLSPSWRCFLRHTAFAAWRIVRPSKHSIDTPRRGTTYIIYIYIYVYIYIYTYIHILTDCARNMHRGIHAQHRIERKGAAHETVPVRGRLGHWKKAYRDLTEAGLLFLCSLS